jgi:hypothetical protein
MVHDFKEKGQLSNFRAEAELCRLAQGYFNRFNRIEGKISSTSSPLTIEQTQSDLRPSP